MIWAMIPGWLKRAVAWLAAGLGALWLAWRAGKREARAESALEAAETHAKTMERIQDADVGLGATDADRIERLRDFADGKR